jgi:hypothetical protein
MTERETEREREREGERMESTRKILIVKGQLYNSLEEANVA